MSVFSPNKRALEIAEATPPERDRYIDFLRVVSILTVLLGHYIMAVVEYDHGTFHDTNALIPIPVLRYVTWVFQVMPLFFLVGGYAHAVILTKAQQRGQDYTEFIYGRVKRLTHPVLIYLAVWIPVATIMYFGGVNAANRQLITRLATQLLWFIGAYLIVAAFAPPMYRLHQKFGGKEVIVMYVGIVVTDLVRFGGGIANAGFVNFVLVWLAVHQLGFVVYDGKFANWNWRKGLALALPALFFIWLLVQFGPYPTSMVGLPGERISNMFPPNLMIASLGLVQLGIVIALQHPARRWLANAHTWARVITVGSVIMSIFLWHLTALLLALIAFLPRGVPQPEVGTLTFWAMKAFWIGTSLMFLAGILAIVGRYERVGVLPKATVSRSTLVTICGVVLLILGVLGLAGSGLVSLGAVGTKRLIFMPSNPGVNLANFFLGLALVSRGAGRAFNNVVVAPVILAVLAMIAICPWLSVADSATHYFALSRIESTFALIALCALSYQLSTHTESDVS